MNNSGKEIEESGNIKNEKNTEKSGKNDNSIKKEKEEKDNLLESEKPKAKKNNPHSGHRERKKEVFFDKDLDIFPEHEVLEVLLYYAIPFKDTNEIAHELINAFGSLNGVLKAGYDDLIKVKGVKESTAYMLCFFRRTAALYLKNEYKNHIFELNNTDALSEYCKILFLGAQSEQFKIIFLDDDLSLIGDKLLATGTPGKLNVPFRTVIEEIIKVNCSRIVIAHNHPVGTCIPSNADVNYTRGLWQALKPMDIDLVDHIIIGADGEWSMRGHSSMPEIWRL